MAFIMKGRKYEVTYFELGKELEVYYKKKIRKCRLIKTSLKGYNILVEDLNECIFSSARTPHKWIKSPPKFGLIPILHSPQLIFNQNINQ